MKNTSGIYPAGYRVLVKPEPIETKSSGGIIIANTEPYQQAQIAGRLIAVGPEAWKDSAVPWAKVGERVWFAKYGGLTRTGLDGEEYRLINDEQVTAVLDEALNVSDIETVAKRRVGNV